MFAGTNLYKRDVTFDPTSAASCQLLGRLLEDADVGLELLASASSSSSGSTTSRSAT